MSPWLEFALGGGMGVAIGGSAIWWIFRSARRAQYLAELERHDAFCRHLDDVLQRQKAAWPACRAELQAAVEILREKR